jgi:uroporphyrinogen-III synthase
VSLRVLVTRAPHQASALADALRAHGLDPILIPTIEIAPPTSFAALDAALASLTIFHWIIFTSTNAVEAFFARLHSSDPYSLIPNPCLTAAIGPATALALEPFGIKPTLIPPQAIAESLAAALTPHAKQPDGSPTRFLLPRAETARDVLSGTLTAAGADVTLAPVYRNLIPADSFPAIRQLFATPATCPDAITFTSGSTVTNLLALLEAAGLTLPPEPLRISIGPITSATLRGHGLPPHAEADQPTIPALVQKTSAALLHMKS